MSDKQQDDELTAAYRRASASDADRPGAATRAAILAEAAAAARRNAPAANESRYWLRAVAGIAVLGIGVVLWRQTYDRLPVDMPVVASAPVRQVESTPLPTDVAKQEIAAVKAERPAREVVREFPSPQPFPASAASPPAAAADEAPRPAVESRLQDQIARNDGENELSEVTVTGVRVQAESRERAAAPRTGAAGPRVGGPAPGGGAGGGRPRAQDNTALLRQHFPVQYLDDASHSVWLVLDAAGEGLLSGELAPGQRLENLAPQLARTLSDRVPGPWQIQTLRNARGQPIEFAIARLP